MSPVSTGHHSPNAVQTLHVRCRSLTAGLGGLSNAGGQGFERLLGLLRLLLPARDAGETRDPTKGPRGFSLSCSSGDGFRLNEEVVKKRPKDLCLRPSPCYLTRSDPA